MGRVIMEYVIPPLMMVACILILILLSLTVYRELKKELYPSPARSYFGYDYGNLLPYYYYKEN